MSGELEILPPTQNSLEQIERAQYDIAVATAHRYPRNIEQFTKDAVALVKSDQDTAESCIFRRNVGKSDNGQVEYAEGMSVRMAEIVASCYGNIVYGSMIIEQTDRFVKARGQARDLQKNVSASSEVVESTVTKKGQPFSERMRIVVAKAALSKARRDALFQVVPRALCKPIEAAARQVITGSQKPLDQRRGVVLAWIQKTGIDSSRVWAALGIKSAMELNDDQLVELHGIRTALKDGEITIDEAFPVVESKPKETLVVEQKADDGDLGPAKTPEPKADSKPAEPVASSREQLTALVLGEGHNWERFHAFIVAQKWFEKAELWTGFEDVSEDQAKRIIGAKRGLIMGMNTAKAKEAAK